MKWMGMKYLDAEDEGQGLVEFGLILVLIIIIVVAVLAAVGPQLSTLLGNFLHR